MWNGAGSSEFTFFNMYNCNKATSFTHTSCSLGYSSVLLWLTTIIMPVKWLIKYYNCLVIFLSTRTSYN